MGKGWVPASARVRGDERVETLVSFVSVTALGNDNIPTAPRRPLSVGSGPTPSRPHGCTLLSGMVAP